MSDGLSSFPEPLGENLFYCLFQLLGATYSPCDSLPPSSRLENLHLSDHSSLVISPSDSPLQPPSSTAKGPANYVGPTQIIQDNLLILGAAD